MRCRDNRFLDFIHVAFRVGLKEESEFEVPGNHMKHRFFNLNYVAFLACQESENAFKVPRESLNIPLSTSFKSNFGLVMSSKCQVTIWNIAFSIETSHILEKSKERIWVQS